MRASGLRKLRQIVRILIKKRLFFLFLKKNSLLFLFSSLMVSADSLILSADTIRMFANSLIVSTNSFIELA